MDKSALRKYILQQADTLSEQYVRSAGKEIAEAVLASAVYQGAETIFIYVSTPREPDTREILSDAWAAGKTVYVPKCRGIPFMDAVRVSGFEELSPGTLGILEPVRDTPLNVFSALDLAVVPCVSASRDGRRLGHGAGYYDTFLSGTASVKLCLCFEKLLCNTIPMTEHDVWMDYVVTEEGLNSCLYRFLSGHH